MGCFYLVWHFVQFHFTTNLKRIHIGAVFKNRVTSCVGVRKTGTTLIRVSTVMGTLYIENEQKSLRSTVKAFVFLVM